MEVTVCTWNTEPEQPLPGNMLVKLLDFKETFYKIICTSRKKIHDI